MAIRPCSRCQKLHHRNPHLREREARRQRQTWRPCGEPVTTQNAMALKDNSRMPRRNRVLRVLGEPGENLVIRKGRGKCVIVRAGGLSDERGESGWKRRGLCGKQKCTIASPSRLVLNSWFPPNTSLAKVMSCCCTCVAGATAGEALVRPR